MDKFKPILVTEDLFNSEHEEVERRGKRVRQFASNLAQKLNTNLELFSAVDDYGYFLDYPNMAEAYSNLVRYTQSKLKQQASELPVNTEAVIYKGSPVQGILEEIKKNFSIVIQGSRAQRGFKRALIGSVAEEVIRNSHLPVITIGPEADQLTLSTPLRILVSSDLGQNSRPAEEFAIKLAQSIGAEVILSHTPFRGLESGLRTALGAPYAPIFSEQLYQESVEAARETLKDRTAELSKTGVKCSGQLHDEDLFPVTSLLKVIQKEKPFIVVMGSHGRNQFSSFYLGSNTREMILKSPIPVMTVRTAK